MTNSQSESQVPLGSIVLADNDRFVLEAVGELLRNEGYDVHLAHDGLEALQLVREVKPSYVILDIIMPKLDGGRVCWLIRQDPSLRDIPVIAFSSISAQGFRHFPELSADAYVAKGPLPVAFQNILQALSHVEKRKRGDLSSGLFGFGSIRPRQIVEELLKERRRFLRILHALAYGVVELDTAGHIVMASASACDLLEKKEASLLGESLISFCQARDRKVMEDLLAELRTATSPAQRQAVVKFGNAEVPLRLCALVEERECIGILVVMESSSADPSPPTRAGG